jgi:hypothetical protein
VLGDVSGGVAVVVGVPVSFRDALAGLVGAVELAEAVGLASGDETWRAAEQDVRRDAIKTALTMNAHVRVEIFIFPPRLLFTLTRPGGFLVARRRSQPSFALRDASAHGYDSTDEATLSAA